MNVKHIIKDNVKYHKVMLGETPLFTSRVTISGTWSATYSSNCMEVVISGEVELNDKVDCYSLTFEEGGHLTINAGARLRVWEGGIVNNDCTTNNYLTIKYDSPNVQFGEFLLHPSVNTNNHPLATVEFTTFSYVNSNSDYLGERFGNPSSSLSSISALPNNVEVTVQKYDNSLWTKLGRLNGSGVNAADLIAPFMTHINTALRTQSAAPVTIYFIGQLVGNGNETFNITHYWTAFANSYTAKIDISSMLPYLADKQVIQQFVKYDPNRKTDWVDISPANDPGGIKLLPMQAFIITKTYGVTQTESVTMSYADIVWNPSLAEDAAVTTRGLAKGALTHSELPKASEAPAAYDPDPIDFEALEPSNEQR